ncbi:MAG TPA: CARDB domain-containing protein, partial [Candidatus Limnocylindria bacterium]|nr:CARDB domain-containing protein [Candidatus Limnocylindria bacterium]
MTITLAAHTVSEGAGANATSGTLTRSPVTAQPVVVQLVSGNTAAAQVPSSVTILANQTNVSFSVAAINNALVDGDKNAVITGFVLDSTTSQRLREATPDALTVTDDDGPTLTLVIATDVVGEGLNPATTAIVTRNAGTNVDLLVNLASSDTTEATVPVSVHIPVGSYSTNFTIASIADGVTDGNQTVTFTASAASFTSGSDTLVVSDADLPDLVVASISFATNGITDQNVAATFRIENRGLKAVTNAFVQRIYLSSDPYVGGDVLASQLDFAGTLDVGQFFSQTVSLRMPAAPGERWVVVETDAIGAVTELLENNNALVSTNRIIIAPAYTALAQTDVGEVLANTPIPIYGQATLAGGGVAANVPLTLHIEVRGVRRTFSIFAGPDGRFTNVFHPLPNEAGIYHIAAAYPGVVNPPSQDTFTFIGMSIAPVGLVNVTEASTVVDSARIDNLSDVPLTALTAVVVTNQPNLTVNVSLSTNTLAGFSNAALVFSITAANAVIYQSPVVLRVTSAEGAVAEVIITVRVEALLPRLVVTPGSLLAAMLRGGQTSVPFTIANQGGLATGPLEILLPNEPWLSLASPANMPPLPPGTNTSATLLLTPATNLPLGDYNGNLVVRSTNAAISVPFTFRAVSDAKGSLLLTAEDEYTYFAAGNPKVTNATIILSDALSGQPVITNYTAADGTFLFTNLTEAYYIVDVRAEGHSPFRETALVAGGQTTNVTAFLTRQTVRYSFTVVPTTVEDRYTFQVDSTFETQVPVPVCTISPASLDLGQYPGDEFQVQFTVANHGLVAADDVELNIPNTDRLQFTALITNIGRLAANTSLTIPVLVRRIAAPLKGLASASSFNDGRCSVTANMLWNYLCGPNVVDKDTAFYMFDSTGCDLVDLYRQVYDLVPVGGGGAPGPVLTSDEFFDYLNEFQIVTDFEAPAGYKFQCKPTAPALVKPPKGGKNLSETSSVTSTNTEVCARVQIRLDQRAVLARDAFKATLELDNATASSIGNILVSLEIKDVNGSLVNSVFGIRPPEFAGISAVDGTGVVAGNSIGRASWVLIPTLDAAPTNASTLYLVGGTLSYVQDGIAVTIPLAPAPIQVLPQPELLVRYFHERDVYADDPFTIEVEPSIPYSLAVQIDNVGYGAARSLKLTSGQPEILDNAKGLLIDFKILGTQLENQSLTPSLEVDFGRIDPLSNKVARWLFTSTLQGSFTNYAASFQHVDALGNPRLSLVRGTEIHELNRIVQADRTFQDGRPDLLVNDAPDSDLLPDTLYLSDGSIVP